MSVFTAVLGHRDVLQGDKVALINAKKKCKVGRMILSSATQQLLFARYVENRCNIDEQTLGGRLYELYDELNELDGTVAHSISRDS